MGSFNTTCFASQQTIAPGDECYVWPIIQQSGYTPVELVHKEETHAVHAVTYSTCHPNRFWTPYGCLIAAKYDDYGSVALTDTLLNRRRIFHLLCSLYAQNLVVREGENKSHDVAFDFRGEAAKLAPNLLSHLDRFKRSGSPMMVALEELPLEVLQEDHAFPELVELWNAMWQVSQEHRLFGISTLQFLRPVQFAVMHRTAYDRLIALAEEGRSWNRSSLVRRPFLESALARAREDRNRFMLEHATLDKLELMASLMYKDWLRERLSAAGTISGVFYYPEALELAGIRNAEEPGSAEEQQLIERLVLALDMRYVLEGLSRLNLHLGPIVYAEQDYSNAIGQDYAVFVQKISEEITRQRRYDDDGDE